MTGGPVSCLLLRLTLLSGPQIPSHARVCACVRACAYVCVCFWGERYKALWLLESCAGQAQPGGPAGQHSSVQQEKASIRASLRGRH